jgi:hypothetical protein
MFPQLLQMLFDIINIEKYYHSGGYSTQVTIHRGYELLF